MLLNVSHQFLPKQNSTRTAIVMDHFGINFEQGQHVIARDIELPLTAGQIVLFTGESGSGKSSLMRASAAALAAEGQQVLNLDDLELGELPLVDALPTDVNSAMQLLATCGLSEAQLMLRTPAELSDGQRYRFRLAMALALAPHWIVADEFTATLDRRLAKTISYNLRKVATRTGTGFLLATTHNDIVHDVDADCQVTCGLDGEIALELRDPHGKKKVCHSPTTSGSPPPPKRTGRISLGGITAAINSVSSSS